MTLSVKKGTNGCEKSKMLSPISFVPPRAEILTVYPSLRITSSTRRRVSGLILPVSFSTLETVLMETFASRATSLIVTRFPIVRIHFCLLHDTPSTASLCSYYGKSQSGRASPPHIGIIYPSTSEFSQGAFLRWTPCTIRQISF